MASTPLGDIPGARFHQPIVATHASVASGGANAKLGQIGPFAHPIRVRNAWWTPTGGDNSATATGSYRRLSVRKGGLAGTGTAIIASLGLTATAPSLAPVALTVVDATGTTMTLASGEVLVFSQDTVGGTDSNGTVLAAGQFALAYEVV